jgi:two-component system NtrC family response regulator
MKALLVIDDEPGHRLMVRAVLEDVGWQVFEAASGEEALEFFSTRERRAQVALLDMNMPGLDGQATLERLHRIHPHLPVILLTAYGTVGSAVEAMKCGAFDYLSKPTDNDELILTLNRAWEYSQLQEENTRLRDELAGKNALHSLVGTSAPMRALHDFIRQAGPSEATVLITGESGTGKELIAEALHACSSRSKKPLVKVNCAALPAQLLESELFGYERGAFTGAVKDKPGRFQLASGGTLFLDEIGEMPSELQALLLRVLENQELMKVGGSKLYPVDVRIICASHKPIAHLVQEKFFRLDLYYRIATLKLNVPPLRERCADIPLIIEKKLASQNMSGEIISSWMLETMKQYSWPGNIRELLALIERYIILLEGKKPDDRLFKALFEDLTGYGHDSTDGAMVYDTAKTLKENLNNLRTLFVRKIISDCNGDKRLAAIKLGVSYSSLWRFV